MLFIDRSFEKWKAPKVLILSQKVARSLKYSESYPTAQPFVDALETDMNILIEIKKLAYLSAADKKIRIEEVSVKLKENLFTIAAIVEQAAKFKSDIMVAGFHPGRVQRKPKKATKSGLNKEDKPKKASPKKAVMLEKVVKEGKKAK